MLGCDPKDCVKRLRRDKSGQTKGSGGTAGPRINRRVAAGDSSQAAAGGNLLEKRENEELDPLGSQEGGSRWTRKGMLLLTNTCQSVERCLRLSTLIRSLCGKPARWIDSSFLCGCLYCYREHPGNRAAGGGCLVIGGFLPDLLQLTLATVKLEIFWGFDCWRSVTTGHAWLNSLSAFCWLIIIPWITDTL